MTYTAPLAEIRFVLGALAAFRSLASAPGFVAGVRGAATILDFDPDHF